MRKLFVRFALWILTPKKVIHATIYDRGDIHIRFPADDICEIECIRYQNVPGQVNRLFETIYEERMYYKKKYQQLLIETGKIKVEGA